jgi:hypothetical protein
MFQYFGIKSAVFDGFGHASTPEPTVFYSKTPNGTAPREFAIGVEGFKGVLDKINQNYSTNLFNHESRDGWHLWQILELKHATITR